MIYRHKESGDYYRVLFTCWNVEKQESHMIYSDMQGHIFSRSYNDFYEKFNYIKDAQAEIVPK